MTLQRIAITRAATGLAQGFALYFLYRATEAKLWPATDPQLFSPLLMVSVFVPLIVVAGLGNLRPRTLAAWTAIATVLCAGLAAYAIFRNRGVPFPQTPAIALQEPLLPLAAILFILHSLIVAAEADRRFIASYPRYFDASWKQGVQLVLILLFVGIFWGLLWLGAELFRLIKLEFLSELIRKSWFWMPVTTLAVTSALHVTDARASLVRGARTLKLTLLSWLLPMMTAIAVLFVLALPFTGLDPLWSTRRASSILLTAVAALVFLINAAYQDGQPDTPVAALLRWSRLVAAVAIVPLTALAAYGVLLRVQQYGWTPQRISATAAVVIAACYAAGYAVTAAYSRGSLTGIEIVNVATAFVIVAVLLALFSPLADPARISVADQVARLEAGRTPVDRFDFGFLRFHGAGYGIAALERLKGKQDGPDAVRIAVKASEALAWKNSWQAQQQQTARATPSTRAANITVLAPKDQPLPDSFVQHDWSGFVRLWQLPRCLTADAKCEAILADLDGDGAPEILLFGLPVGPSVAFKLKDDDWTFLGSLTNTNCAGVRDALRAGQFEIAAGLRSIEVAGNRIGVNGDCAPARPATPQ